MTDFPSRPTLSSLRQWYAEGGDPEYGLALLARRIRRDSAPAVWISLVSEEDVKERVRCLKKMAEGLAADEVRRRWPLFCVPFAAKDNMDVAGMETTAACPAYAYTAEETAFVVRRLLDAGAVLMGKTNMDQFATGLVGVRSPYGACPNSFDPAYISGGSSSGSAHAAACGYVTFSLGTDTAGSGRVPAGLNNLVGLKPSRGLLSSRGVVPACPSLDCVSILALTCGDAAEVLGVAQACDEEDIWSRENPAGAAAAVIGKAPAEFTFGVPAGLESLCDNTAWEHAFHEAVSRLEAMGGRAVPVDFAPYREAADMLYFGPYLAERVAAVGGFVEPNAAACDPTVKSIIMGAAHWSAVEMFQCRCRTMEIKKIADRDFAGMDMLLVPTAPNTFTIEHVRRDPVKTNVRMGTYTNFVNILDLCAVAVPAGLTTLPGTRTVMPFGVTMIAPAFSEEKLLAVAAAFHAAQMEKGLILGAPEANPSAGNGTMRLAVCGAHMSGMALNWQMQEAGATLARVCATAPCYRMKLVPGGEPLRPGLVRVEEGGVSIGLEVWDMPRRAVGAFLERIPAPLGLGSVELEDGSWVKGFVCESALLEKAEDISGFGSFRAYLNK